VFLRSGKTIARPASGVGRADCRRTVLLRSNEAVQSWQPEPPDEPQLSDCDPIPPDLEQFLRESNNALVSYIYSRVRSRPDALDIVQEAYCRIFRLGNLQSVNHLRGYLFKTAKNIATNWVRQRIVREAYVQDEPLRGNTEAASPEDIWLAREELEALDRNVENLPPKCRYAFLMVRLEGASYDEVAEKLGIQTHSARRLVERAMEYLLEKKVSSKAAKKAKRQAAKDAAAPKKNSAGSDGQLAV
jgi:RNA polymerase sigma-70 factor (ECF subfamily)